MIKFSLSGRYGHGGNNGMSLLIDALSNLHINFGFKKIVCNVLTINLWEIILPSLNYR